MWYAGCITIAKILYNIICITDDAGIVGRGHMTDHY